MVLTGQDLMKLIRAIKTDDKRGFYITQPQENKRGKITYKRKYLNKREIAKIKNQMKTKVDRSKFRDINQVFIYGEQKKKKQEPEPEPIQQTQQILTRPSYSIPLSTQWASRQNSAYLGRSTERNATQGINELERLHSKDKEIERLRDKALQAQADKLILKERELSYLKDRLIEFEDQMRKLTTHIDPKVLNDMQKERDKMLVEINEMKNKMVKDEEEFKEREKMVVDKLHVKEKEVSHLHENEVLLKRLKHLIRIGAIRVSNRPVRANYLDGNYRILTDVRADIKKHMSGFYDLGGLKPFTDHRDLWEEVIRERQDPYLIEYLQKYVE